MIYRHIYNPVHTNFAECLDYMTRAGKDSTSVSTRTTNFGLAAANDDVTQLQNACEVAKALAPMTVELGTYARPVTRPFRHAVLSLATGEDLSDREMHDISEQVCGGLVRKYKPAPIIPTITAVHRDTDNLHTHILSIPVDLRTGQRIYVPESTRTYRSVLEPIERQYGLSVPQNRPGGWNTKRYYLPFKTWVRMDRERWGDTKRAILESNNWRSAMQGLAKHGIMFAETDDNFAPTTRYFLRPFGATRTTKGMSIQRDVFSDMQHPPSASECVRNWGAFPRDIQKQIEAEAKPQHRWEVRPIGGPKGELLYRRWSSYERDHRANAIRVRKLWDEAIKQAKACHPAQRTEMQRRMVEQPEYARREMLDRCKPMEFSTWVESMADRPFERDARWLANWGNQYANLDPDLARRCDQEGEFTSDEERELALELNALRREEEAMNEKLLQAANVRRQRIERERKEKEREKKRKALEKDLRDRYQWSPLDPKIRARKMRAERQTRSAGVAIGM